MTQPRHQAEVLPAQQSPAAHDLGWMGMSHRANTITEQRMAPAHQNKPGPLLLHHENQFCQHRGRRIRYEQRQ